MFSIFLVKYKKLWNEQKKIVERKKKRKKKKKKMKMLCPESVFIIEERTMKDLRRSPSLFSYSKAD